MNFGHFLTSGDLIFLVNVTKKNLCTPAHITYDLCIFGRNSFIGFGGVCERTHTQTVLRYYNIDEFQVSKMCVDMIIYSAIMLIL